MSVEDRETGRDVPAAAPLAPPPVSEPWLRHVGRSENSLPEVHGSVPIPITASFWRKMFAFAGPGYLVAVGYMDPGNWATDIAGGARYGYALLSVIMISNLMAILLQALAARLGHRQRARPRAGLPRQLLAARDLVPVGAGRDRHRRHRSRRGDRRRHRAQPAVRPAAAGGVCITALDVLIVLYLQQHGSATSKALVRAAHPRHRRRFAIELVLSQPATRRGASRVHPDHRDRAQSRDAVHRDRHPRRHRHAAQPVPALVDRADAEVRRRPREPARAP